MELFFGILLKIVSAAFIPFSLFVITTTARRPRMFERYSWAVLTLGLVALSWLTNGYLNQNTRLLSFMYPQFLGFIFLIGPGFYFGITGLSARNMSALFLHLGSAGCIFLAGIYATYWHPLSESDFIHAFRQSERLTSLPWSFIGDQFILALILPFHFLIYAISACVKTREFIHVALLVFLTLLLVVFSGIYIQPANIQWTYNIKVIALIVEIAILILVLRYLIIDTPSRQFRRKEKLNLEPLSYDKIEAFLYDSERSEELFSLNGITFERIAAESNVDQATWKNFLSDEEISFVGLKKRIRISKANKLIKQGFLKSYTIDHLSEEIGYSSRTSFYSAYKEVMGVSWQNSPDR